MSIEVHKVGPSQVPDLARTMGRAFAADPMIVWPFRAAFEPDEARAIELFSILLPHYAEAEVAWGSGGELGCAVWVPPGRIDIFVSMDRATREPVAALTDDGGARYDAMWDWIGSHVGDEPSWFLDMLGVDPATQGHGHGSALLEIGLAGSRRDGVPAVLETAMPNNVAYYERRGFRVVADEDAPGGGPHLWFMRREP